MRRLSLPALLALATTSAAACNDAPKSATTAASPVRPSLAYAPSTELQAASSSPIVALWDTSRGRPVRVRGAFASTESSAERAARAFLRRHAGLFQLRADGHDLDLAATRSGLAGTYLRFQEVVPRPAPAAPLPVFEGQVVVLVADSPGGLVVRGATLAHRAPFALPEAATDVGPARALDAARAALGAPQEDGRPEVVRGVGGDPARIAYRVRLSAIDPDAAWEALVDASTGDVLATRDRIVRATGTGFVFDPSPVATTGDATLADNGNATTPALDAARFSVALPNLDGSGYLKGLWVDAHTKNVNLRAFNAALTFDYTRADSGFEQVNAYFHIDRAQTRIQSLGFANVNAHAQEVLSDGQQADNSYFDPAKGAINYGQGGVDDAEDGDVVLHEYGHAIQEDQVPGYGAGGDAGAMGEGFGDYLASSFNRVLSQQITDPDCVAEWDATAYAMGNPPCLRRTDGKKHFPEHAVGEVHDDGEMWSSALVSLDVSLGADVMNRIVVEAHFAQSTTETFFGASQALLDADANLFAGAHQDAIRRRLIQQGLARILSAPSPLSDVVSSVAVSIDNPLVGGVYADLLDDTQTFTQPGALALRLHFSTIDTELDPSCLDGACDNIYLTDANGDLYQVLAGQQSDVLSVVVPGDTVNIRLVTDGNTPKTGYHVDRVDVMGDVAMTSGVGGATSGTGGAGGATSGTGGATSGTGGTGGAGGATASSSSGSTGTGGAGMTTGSSSSGSSSVGSGGEGGGAVPKSDGVDEKGGCGCRVAGEPSVETVPVPVLIGGLLAAAGAVRRRRSRTR